MSFTVTAASDDVASTSVGGGGATRSTAMSPTMLYASGKIAACSAETSSLAALRRRK